MQASINRILLLLLSSATILHAAPTPQPKQKTESTRSHNVLATMSKKSAPAYTQLTRQPAAAAQVVNKRTKPVIPFGLPQSSTLSKFFDEDGNEYDYNTMTVRFNPCVNGISSRVCVIDSKVSELDEHLTSCCDEINTNVDSCCAQLSSELSSCCEGINAHIESCCDGVHSNIDGCCEQLSEQIASCCVELDTSLDSCCSQIESHLTVIEQKIDEINPSVITSCCDKLESLIGGIDTDLASCCSQIESHLTVIEQKIDEINPSVITSCCDKLESLIGGIDTDLASCCETINSKLDAACGATAIHQRDVPYVIRQPGHYCVAENLQGTSPIITISASDVHLDLNGYELRQTAAGALGTGIIMTDNSTTHSSIVIENGFIVGGGNRAGIIIGALFPIQSHDDFVIEDVSIRNCTNGIDCITANKIRIKDSICYSNTTNGLRSASTTGLVVENSEFNSNAGSGIHTELLSTSSGENKQCSMFNNCSASDNVTAGFNIFGIFNPIVGNSFVSEIVLDGCYTCSNGIGYRFDVVTDTYVTQCVAHRNRTAGFSMNTTSTVSEAIVKECIAQGNGTFGFLDGTGSSSTHVQYYANNACDNGDNYSANIDAQNHAPVTSPANARGVDNVDCARSDVDQIDILQSCCEQVSNDVESIASCCEMVNSKLDAACGATAIHQSDVPYFITQPGHYCVAENLDGSALGAPTISIVSSDVHLDLNGYEITNADNDVISIDSTVIRIGIVIENGFIIAKNDPSANFIHGIAWNLPTDGSKDLTLKDLSIYNFISVASTGGSGIEINAAGSSTVETVKILNCNVYNNTENIRLTNCNQVYIDQCLISNATGNEGGSFGNGGTFRQCKSVTIKNSSFFKNWHNGLEVNPDFSDILLIEDSLFNDNSLTGSTDDFAGLKLNSAFIQAHLINCSFSITDANVGVGPSYQQYGLFASASNIITAEHCQAHSNLEKGFYLNGGKVTLIDCQAHSNGFFDTLSQFGFGFHLKGSFVASIRDCYAADNFGHGFVIDQYSDSVFTNCVAERNGQNGSLTPNFPRGFIIAGNSNNVLFDHCVAISNRVDGFAITATACDTCAGGIPANICFTQCTAKSNGTTDGLGNPIGAGFKFEVIGSSGLCKECVAVNNRHCGFETWTTSVGPDVPKFVANLGQDNGDNPANVQSSIDLFDSNYCAPTPTAFSTATGFSNVPPYFQVDTSAPAVAVATGPMRTGYWANVTLK